MLADFQARSQANAETLWGHNATGTYYFKDGYVDGAAEATITSQKVYTSSNSSSNANQGGGSQAAFVGGAVLSSGWTADGLDPEPFSKVGGAIVMTGVSAYVLYQNRAVIANSAVSLYNKMTAEIDRIAQKAQGPQGFQYALVAEFPGLYPNVRGGTTFLNAGDVWKYGQTTDPTGRYGAGYLQNMGLIQVNQFQGNQMEIRIQEKVMIYGYFMQNGSLPAGNSIFR